MARKAPDTIVVNGVTYARVAEQAPEPEAKAASPFVADAREGHKMTDTRAYNLAHKVARKHCAACKAGFVYEKDTCPRCKATLS